jgi:hypothetical protein
MQVLAALLLPLLVAAATAPLPPIEELGAIRFPAGAPAEIRGAASAKGIEIAAVEAFAGGFLGGVFAYGPPSKARDGLCRGAVFLVDAREGAAGAERWQIRPLAESALRARYALARGDCRGSLAARVLILGAIDDAEVAAILKAARQRTIAPQDAPFPRHVAIDRAWIVNVIRAEEQKERVTLLMSDPSKPQETLTVLMEKSAAGWGIVDSGDVSW